MRKEGGSDWRASAASVCGATMWWRAVLWQATLLLASATLDVRYYSQKRLYTPVSQVECFDYPEWRPSRYTRASPGGWIHQNRPSGIPGTGIYSPPAHVRSNFLSRRFDVYPSKVEDVVKEHAKLVQDINGLKQALYVAPLVDRSKDYDDSIYLEAIETTTTAPWSTTTASVRSKKPGSSIPVILVGEPSQHTVIKSQPLKFTRPAVSLVGASVTPLVRQPYPFVVHPSAAPPVRICMPSAVYTKNQPSLLQRILKGFVSR
ncbi:unnamed protein product, partial [Iphiclides podalirius]